MAVATKEQVQTFVDLRMRVRSEMVRAVVVAMDDDRAVIGDVYEACNAPSPTWIDKRDDPPNKLVPTDVLAFNTFIVDVLAYIKAHASYPIVRKSCVRPPA